MSAGDRMVFMTADQAKVAEEQAVELMRRNQNERASKLMALTLSYKFAPEIDPPAPDNVVELNGFSRRVGA